jgi:hypothetical protein
MDPVDVNVGDTIFTRSYKDLLGSFEKNEHRQLVFDSTDMSMGLLKVLKKSRTFVVSRVDSDGDIGFHGFISTFPKECVQCVVGAAA